jgi:uncharacterized membrane protein
VRIIVQRASHARTEVTSFVIQKGIDTARLAQAPTARATSATNTAGRRIEAKDGARRYMLRAHSASVNVT